MTTSNPFRLTELDPAEWSVIGYFYQGASVELADAYKDDHDDLDAALAALGLAWTDLVRHDNGGCAHCGARYHHGAVAYRAADRVALAIGHTCAGERFGLTLKADLATKYGKAKAARERAERAERFAALCAEHEGLADAFEHDHHITRDIRSYAFRFGQISDKQLALVFKLAREAAERAAETAARLATAEPCPTGRVVITGTVKGFKETYSDWGTCWKITVEDDRGFRVYGTYPSALSGLAKGDRVTFTAAVEPSRDDPHFGFYKRPTKALALAS